MKKNKNIDTFETRVELDKTTPTSEITLSEQIKRMRQITKKTQIAYAKMLGIAPRIIIDLENNKGNPTLSTLTKIGKPFGYSVSFVKQKNKSN